MYKNIAISHERFGIYVGQGMRIHFWSQQDSGSQEHAAVFESVEQAQDYALKFGRDAGIQEFQFHEVETEEEFHASVDELRDAGLGDLLGSLNKARTLS